MGEDCSGASYGLGFVCFGDFLQQILNVGSFENSDWTGKHICCASAHHDLSHKSTRPANYVQYFREYLED